MQSMGNVNKIIMRFILPLLFLIYFAYIIFNYTYIDNFNNTNNFNRKKAYILSKTNIQGVVLGGANAVLGLSAEILTKNTNDEWVNLALPNEGWSDNNYWNYVENTLTQKQRTSTKMVVYSSLSSTRLGNISERLNNKNYNVIGKKHIALLPSQSILSLLRSYYTNKKLRGSTNPKIVNPNFYGDFDFSPHSCKELPSTNKEQLNNNRQYNENIQAIKKYIKHHIYSYWIEKQLSKIQELFPNTTVYFVQPSVFDNNLDKISFMENKEIISKAVYEYNQKFNSQVIFIDQEYIPNKNLLCDAGGVHLNETGRIWRTNNLIKRIYK
ncbi:MULTISPECIES: hypothetical protein [unclassified Moraxella]|uniref:hypothetical protein n=1 Tax=unclassified Moraxella TaxID=2685852 RepID=UPI003AF76C01